ncbi:MAG: DUF4097 family beta strand repeat-containing protein [Sedimentibacter sp.]|uniref:DUF4097 family beta strand repeat-containing protein n=1 Tax=Sedimentibacter sp. TaxID=1960295 RepID=UPI00298119B2|nr:DUF4097 family beta strand repeat-containing protein [Sedimentibacter sp.]MDW5299025.1 DUF4097 family beta strand repeat-containing protein [Sedimentibacter sp.]
MKKTANILITIIAIMSLSGCTSNFKVNEDAVKEVSDKITETIIDTVGKEKAEKQESQTINAVGLKTLNIKSAVGDINITTHESEDAIININIASNSNSKEKAEQLIEDFTYTAEKQFNSIVIDTSNQGRLIDNDRIETELNISIPSNIENIIISLNVGNINIKNINGKFEAVCNVSKINIENSTGFYNLKTDVGDIVLNESTATEKSEFFTNTGDIKLSLSDITNAKAVTAKTSVGSIKMSLPENSSYKTVINEFMKDEKVETKGEGKTKIALETGVGSIDFN